MRADRRNQRRGFTLIEVLVALVVVSLGMLAVIQTVGQTANNSAYMRDKTVAHWIAMNQLTEVRLQSNPPAIDKSSDEIEMNGRDWRWTMEVQQTAIETIRRIDIRVRLADAPETSSLVKVSGFYGSAIAPPGSALINWQGSQAPGAVGGPDGTRPGDQDSETAPPPQPQPDPAEPEEDSPGLPEAEPDS